MMPWVLPMEDEMASTLIARELKKAKVKVHTGIKVEGLEPSGNLIAAILSDGKKLEAAKILVSIGRAFNTADIGLDKNGRKVSPDKQIRGHP